MISVITNTGGRPEALELCCKYMDRQSYKGNIQWIVTDDVGDVPEKLPIKRKKTEALIYHLEPHWAPGINTQIRNLDYALRRCVGRNIYFFEDDDWYSPDYFSTYENLFDTMDWDAIGEKEAKYYNVTERCWRPMNNKRNASLAQTAIRFSLLDVMLECVWAGELYVDMELWRRVERGEVKGGLFNARRTLSVGIKAMPGRVGIGCGHRPKNYNFVADAEFKMLPDLIGRTDAAAYERFYASSAVPVEEVK